MTQLQMAVASVLLAILLVGAALLGWHLGILVFKNRDPWDGTP